MGVEWDIGSSKASRVGSRFVMETPEDSVEAWSVEWRLWSCGIAMEPIEESDSVECFVTVVQMEEEGGGGGASVVVWSTIPLPRNTSLEIELIQWIS